VVHYYHPLKKAARYPDGFMIRFEREFTKFQKMGTFTKEGKMGYGDVLVTIGFVPFCR